MNSAKIREFVDKYDARKGWGRKYINGDHRLIAALKNLLKHPYISDLEIIFCLLHNTGISEYNHAVAKKLFETLHGRIFASILQEIIPTNNYSNFMDDDDSFLNFIGYVHILYELKLFEKAQILNEETLKKILSFSGNMMALAFQINDLRLSIVYDENHEYSFEFFRQSQNSAHLSDFSSANLSAFSLGSIRQNSKNSKN